MISLLGSGVVPGHAQEQRSVTAVLRRSRLHIHFPSWSTLTGLHFRPRRSPLDTNPYSGKFLAMPVIRKTALVTGAGQGFGQGIVCPFVLARHGARVGVAGRTAAKAVVRARTRAASS